MANYNEENEVMNEEKVTTANKVAAKEKAKDSRDAEIEALKAQIALLTDMMAKSYGSAPATAKNSLTEEVTIVHLIQCFDGLKTHIELKTRNIDLVAFGETRTLDRREAEELAGKYRKFFERGIIAFGKNDSEIAGRFDLKSVRDYEFFNSDFVRNLGNLNVVQLEELYNKLGEAHKQFIIEYFKRKIRENDPRFNDISKIELLERLTRDEEGHGAMEGVLIDRQNKK